MWPKFLDAFRVYVGECGEYHKTVTIAERDVLQNLHKVFGGKGIRTPDFQLAKLALYQLSYAPL